MRPHANVSVLLYSFKTLISISSDKSNSRQRHHWLFDYEWISEIAVPSFKFHGKHRNILGGYSAHQAFGVCVCDLASLKLVYCNYQVRDFRIKTYFDLVVYDLLYVWYCVAKKAKNKTKKNTNASKKKHSTALYSKPKHMLIFINIDVFKLQHSIYKCVDRIAIGDISWNWHTTASHFIASICWFYDVEHFNKLKYVSE